MVNVNTYENRRIKLDKICVGNSTVPTARTIRTPDLLSVAAPTTNYSTDLFTCQGVLNKSNTHPTFADTFSLQLGSNFRGFFETTQYLDGTVPRSYCAH